MEGTTARLRKTFHYPVEDDEEEDLPEALDEEEQETLITTLSHANETSNTTTLRLLTILPLICLTPYIPSLFHRPTTFLSLLSITSLLSTTYLLLTLPVTSTGLPFLDALHSTSHANSRTRRGRETAWGAEGDDGPIKTYLPYLNLGLCIVLFILRALVGRRGEVWVGFGWLPGFVYAVVVVAKWVMGSVDPEGELGGLRYRFKGA